MKSITKYFVEDRSDIILDEFVAELKLSEQLSQFTDNKIIRVNGLYPVDQSSNAIYVGGLLADFRKLSDARCIYVYDVGITISLEFFDSQSDEGEAGLSTLLMHIKQVIENGIHERRIKVNKLSSFEVTAVDLNNNESFQLITLTCTVEYKSSRFGASS